MEAGLEGRLLRVLSEDGAVERLVREARRRLVYLKGVTRGRSMRMRTLERERNLKRLVLHGVFINSPPDPLPPPLLEKQDGKSILVRWGDERPLRKLVEGYTLRVQSESKTEVVYEGMLKEFVWTYRLPGLYKFTVSAKNWKGSCPWSLEAACSVRDNSFKLISPDLPSVSKQEHLLREAMSTKNHKKIKKVLATMTREELGNDKLWEQANQFIKSKEEEIAKMNLEALWRSRLEEAIKVDAVDLESILEEASKELPPDDPFLQSAIPKIKTQLFQRDLEKRIEKAKTEQHTPTLEAILAEANSLGVPVPELKQHLKMLSKIQKVKKSCEEALGSTDKHILNNAIQLATRNLEHSPLFSSLLKELNEKLSKLQTTEVSERDRNKAILMSIINDKKKKEKYDECLNLMKSIISDPYNCNPEITKAAIKRAQEFGTLFKYEVAKCEEYLRICDNDPSSPITTQRKTKKNKLNPPPEQSIPNTELSNIFDQVKSLENEIFNKWGIVPPKIKNLKTQILQAAQFKSFSVEDRLTVMISLIQDMREEWRQLNRPSRDGANSDRKLMEGALQSELDPPMVIHMDSNPNPIKPTSNVHTETVSSPPPTNYDDDFPDLLPEQETFKSTKQPKKATPKTWNRLHL
eukprot:TRINITY_DN9298_c0_g1_i1.p1 TRINITY_DN9298_c0_g1~~TRINITY_DN9298_c0_g1_i1.p1  ORF type:complete len:636 (-),score=155.63 TRINITY_DN9298_c0_g1_i1:23-1930(-)